MKIILLITLVIVNFYLIYKLKFKTKKTENFEFVNDSIYEGINNKYNASVESIRQLSTQIDDIFYNVDEVSLATPTTIANNLDVTTKIKLTRNLIVENDLIVDGDVEFTNREAALLNILPQYMILMWNTPISYRAIAPAGWAFCDGKKYILDEDGFAVEVINNGIETPDLRGRVMFGSGQNEIKDINNNYVPSGLTNKRFKEYGGEEAHTLTVGELATHRHTLLGQTLSEGKYINGYNHVEQLGVAGSGGSQSHNNMPPFSVLTYIMKL